MKSNLEKIIHDKGYNVYSLSQKINIPRTSLKSVIARDGMYKLRIDYTKKIADELGYTLDQFYDIINKAIK